MTEHSQLTLEHLPSQSEWSIFRIPCVDFPGSAESVHILRRFYLTLDNHVRTKHPHVSAFLQYNQLHLGGAGTLLAERGKDWMPSWGLGYEPHKPPPTLWTRDEFLNLDVGEMPRPMMHQLFQITTGETQIVKAAGELGGLGSLLLTRAPNPIADVLRQSKARFQPLIHEMSLKNFAWYLPLFDLNALQTAANDAMREWACGLTFYLRESPEDKGVIVAVVEQVDSLFKAIGAKQENKQLWSWTPAPVSSYTAV